MTSWKEEEFSEGRFNDERLDRRFAQLVDQLGECAGRSIPFACEDWASTKAAYRFFDNPKVSQEEIIRPHREATQRRAEQFLKTRKREHLLVIQDTSFLNYSHHPKTSGLGEISKFADHYGNGKMQVHGLLLHTALALTPEGVPLGMLSQKLWTRKKPIGRITQSGKNMTRIPIEEKESFRWIQAMREASQWGESSSRLVHLGDRESDIFEFFREAKELGTHFLVRIRDHQRCIEEGGRIFDPADRLRSKGTYALVVKTSDGGSRTAKISVKYYPVTVRPSVAKKELEPVAAWVIVATEVSTPPKGEDQIDWKLLTDLEIPSFENALEKIGWYTKRWNIEVFHKVLKSGCKVLDCRLQTAERLLRYVTLMTVVAWRIFWMTVVSREAPQLKAEAVLSPEEIEAIRLYADRKKKRVPERTASAREWVRALAGLGGFLARKIDGDPGPFILWRAHLRLQDIMLGMSLASA
jgi:hypothetical protein